MVTNMREQIGTVLDDLREEKRKALKRQLLTRPNSADRGFGSHVSRDLKERALQALEHTVYEMVSDAVSRVSPISKAASVFADIEGAVVSGFLDLSQDLEAWYQGKVGLPSGTIVDTNRADAIRQQLQRQLDNCRPEFTNASAGPTRLKNAVGRKPKYDWVEATNAVWAMAFRGDLNPVAQPLADIELTHFSETEDEEPSESTVRPYAQRVKDWALREA